MSGAIFRLLERCRGCHAPSTAWREVLRMDPMPLAGQFCRSEAAAREAHRIPLTWIECTRCGLVQVLEDVDDRVLFTEYNYASSTVPGLVHHFESYAGFLAERYGAKPVRLAEIGCNDGVLLRRLPPTWDLLGIDPSDVAEKAPQKNYELIQLPFTGALAAKVPAAGRFDVVTGSNCLAHISDLLDVFHGVHTLLRDGGEFILEVHDLEATASTGQWDTIYHEHKVEWSAEALACCLAPIGFEPSFSQKLPLHGGLLRAGFRKVIGKANTMPVRENVSLQTVRRAYDGRRETKNFRAVAEAVSKGRTISGYGASGRANVWLNQLPELRLSYLVDDSPLRAGKFLPCVATRVVPGSHFLSHPTEICVITAWNFAAGIRSKYPRYEGTWLQSLG